MVQGGGVLFGKQSGAKMHQGRVKITKYRHLTAKLGAWMMKPLAAGFVNGVVAIHAHFVWP